PLAVELHKPAPGLTIGPALTDELLRGVDVVRHWQPLAGDDALHAFRAAFERRYGEREVPLTEALDEDAGVGAGVLREGPARPPADERRERLLLAKLEDALRRRAGEIVVERGELEREPVALPPSFVVGARVAAASAAAVDRGDFRVWLKSVRGPDAMGMFTRFCRVDDRLRDRVGAHMRSEEALDPDAVHAEIAHLPQLELGPVLHRPLLRSVEIDYLGPSGAPRERRLQLSDLLVSVAGESVLLRSRRDGRWVVPRLGAALNIDLNVPPAFRLLVLVERQEGIHLGWSWGALRHAPYQPRVRSGRTILAPARWRLDGDDVAALGHGSDAERFRAAARLREARRLPRHVAVTDEDNILPVDLDSTVGVDLLLGLARGRETVDLIEVHPDPSQLVVEGPEGRFAHELIVPFLGRAPRRRAPAPARGGTAAGGGAADAVRRSFAPGSGWLYLKIYSGAGAADEILRRGVAPLCERLAGDGALTGWFFVRYADPDPHLRVRLQVERPERRGDALAQIGELGDALLERRLAWRTTLDTYEREVERYGGATGIELCERWFAADSEAAAALLRAAHERAASADARRRAALLAVDAALDAFGLGDAARHDAMRAAREHRAGLLEEAAGVTDARSFARRYAHRHRREHDALEEALAQARDGAPDALLAPYAERAERFRAIAAELHAAHDAGALTRPPLDLCLSLVHMRVNRLLLLGTPEPEVRLYDALERLYASQLARARRAARHPIP
ncbi:MAG: lantibiotic biosynthesis protein, partial [Solirubrobacteraceae bacterium]|nr:lantibiotic biosynthesis protein [Solirubrobacteraceae bacterium]